MNKRKKQAYYWATFWLVLGILLGLLFFSGGTFFGAFPVALIISAKMFIGIRNGNYDK